MRIFKSLWSNWRGLLGERESGTAIALFRICVGVTILAAVGRTVIAGLAPVVWLSAADGGLLPLLEQPWQVQLLGGLSPAVMWFFVAANLLLATFVVLGLGGRWTILLLLQAFLGISFIDDFIRGCDDKLISNALWLLFLASSTTTLSLDCRMRNGQWTSKQMIPAWPRYLLIWQLVLIYCMSGLQKVSIAWTPFGDYSALYRILQEPTWQRFDMSWLADYYPLAQAATALTWFWEVFFPLVLAALYFRRTRERNGRLRALFNRLHILELFVIVGMLLHLGVWGLIDIGPFSWISLSCYVCLAPSKTWDRLFTRRQIRDHENASPPAASETGGRTKWFVTAFVTVHVVAITLAAFPSPNSVMSRSLWRTPTAQKEFVLWADLFNNAGFDVAPKELEERLWQTGRAYAAFREQMLLPFAPYYKYCGTRQTWQMFTGPESEPSRLKIEVEERGLWRTLFVQSDPQHNWNQRQLGHEHIRTVIYAVCDDTDSKEFRALARWIANRAADDFPHVTRIRVSIERLKIPTPKNARTGIKPAARTQGSVIIILNR